jgi:hypothetical protein
MATVLEGSCDKNLEICGVVGTANTAEDQVVPGYIAVSGETQHASAEQVDNRGAFHNILLFHPSSRTPPRRSSRQTQQPMIFCLESVIFLGLCLSDSRLVVPDPLCGGAGTALDGPSNPSVRAAIAGENDLRVRRVQNPTFVPSEENAPASGPYLWTVISHVAFEVANPAVVIDPTSNQVDDEDGRGRRTRDGRAQHWENVHACSRPRSPDGACVGSPLGYQCVCDRSNAFAARPERACDVSSRGARTWSRPPVGDCARTPA